MRKIVLSIALLGSLALAQTNYTLIPYGKVNIYSGDSEKDYGTSAGIYLSGQENPYETIIAAEGKKVVYKNKSSNDDISQTDIMGMLKFNVTDIFNFRIGIHHIVSTDNLTDGGNTFIGGIKLNNNSLDFDLNVYYTNYDNLVNLNITQLSPEVGFNLGSNYIKIKGDFINIENSNRVAGLKDSYISTEITFKHQIGIFETSLSGWLGKRIFAVSNNGFTINNISDEEKGGIYISGNMQLDNFSSLEVGYSYTKFEEIKSANDGSKNSLNIAYSYKFKD
jgi:hypothetical protein